MRYLGIGLVWVAIGGLVFGITSLQPTQDRADIGGWMTFFGFVAGIIATGIIVAGDDD